ncbi:hypothetical protein OV079_15350 [Nannocystis pusilla]|uniref:Uncharacterized protein n=1 Tax=Nannocystis pusilla TaxID=889268 RepID=A0A9X3EUP9_9BACT|nr:hypothetical protein [Nannocystis pusilla]MCY1006906.1 hypothetical protein [Nannocystis pusilla]
MPASRQASAAHSTDSDVENGALLPLAGPLVHLGRQHVAQARQLGLDVVLRQIAADLRVHAVVVVPLPARDRRLAGDQVGVEGVEIVAQGRVDAEAGDDHAAGRLCLR